MSELKISVPKPCNERWDLMTPSQNGRLCIQCDKEVVDFSALSKAEIVSWFEKHEGRPSCGKFLAAQLDIPERRLKWSSRPSWHLKIVATSILALLVHVKTEAKTRSKPEISFSPLYGNAKPTSDVKFPEKRTDSLIKINGRVVDEADKMPLAGVSVRVINGNNGVVTDERGEFVINVSGKKKTTLSIRYLGFEDKSVQIELKKERPICIELSAATYKLGEFLIIKPPFHKRIWNYITRPFTAKG